MKREILTIAAILSFLAASVGQTPPSGTSTTTATSGWSVAKANDGVHTRWLLKNSQTGELFFGLGVQHISISTSIDDAPLGPCATIHSNDARVKCKYGSRTKWWTFAQKRIQSWGFNLVGPYSYSIGAYEPYDTMPFLVSPKPSTYCVDNDLNLAPNPCKDLLRGLSPAVTAQIYVGGNSRLVDIFDPSYATYLTNRVGMIDDSPFLAGIKLDDEDYTTSWSGAGPDLPSIDGNLMAHAGYLVAVTNFAQTTSKWISPGTYSDTKIYTKYELMNNLAAQYGTIAALNKAWCGATYTSFGDNGGWGVGTGFLDEDGRHPWMGTDPMLLSDACPRTKADLDAFLLHFADQYYALGRAAIKQRFPSGVLVISQTLNNHQGVSRKQVLQKAGQYCDLVLVSVPPAQAYVDYTVEQVGDRPLIVQFFSSANADSELALYSRQNANNYPSQADRATAYASNLTTVFGLVAGDTGATPYAGYMDWSWVDSWGEKVNWGLVDFMDNAYDGVEATTSTSCVDRFGFTCGNEVRDYGNFIGGVTAANQSIVSLIGSYHQLPQPIVNVISPGAGDRVFSQSPLTIQWTVSDDKAVASASVYVSSNGGTTYTPITECAAVAAPLQQCTWMAPGPIGVGTRIRVDAVDVDGNLGSATSGVFSVVTQQATVGVSANLASSVFGQPVTFTATVAPQSGSSAPTGTVIFKSGTLTWAKVPLTGGVAAFTTTPLDSGTKSITATYSGDANFAPTTSPIFSFAVNRADTTTVEASSQNPAAAGQPVTFTATVTSPYAVPTGKVTFSLGDTVLATVPLSAGVASYTTSTLPSGASVITAKYLLSYNFNRSSATITQTVGP